MRGERRDLEKYEPVQTSPKDFSEVAAVNHSSDLTAMQTMGVGESGPAQYPGYPHYWWPQADQCYGQEEAVPGPHLRARCNTWPTNITQRSLMLLYSFRGTKSHSWQN